MKNNIKFMILKRHSNQEKETDLRSKERLNEEGGLDSWRFWGKGLETHFYPSTLCNMKVQKMLS